MRDLFQRKAFDNSGRIVIEIRRYRLRVKLNNLTDFLDTLIEQRKPQQIQLIIILNYILCTALRVQEKARDGLPKWKLFSIHLA